MSAKTSAGHTDSHVALVWIDGESAAIARWDGAAAVVTRMESGIPPRHRSNGPGDGIRHGGHVPTPDSRGRDRDEHVRRFLAEVASAVAPETDLLVVGPSDMPGLLADVLGVHTGDGRPRRVEHRTAAPMTDHQLGALLRERAGHPAPRQMPR
jgi:hypothetical protein